jgi:guanine deaminase
MNDKEFMKVAIGKAREGVEDGQSPFGACIVKNNEIISSAGNSVWKDNDITAHAEIIAIRRACKKMGTIDLTGCILYSTCEPCPMCFSACSWAKISRIVYGAHIEDAKRFGFSEMQISNEKMKLMGNVEVEIKGNFLRDECLEVFKQWSLRSDKKTY